MTFFPTTRNLSCSFVRRGLLSLWVVFSSLVGLQAQTQNLAEPVLTQVKEVRRLGAEEAQDHPRQVKLEGVVVFVNSKRNDFKLHDGVSGIGVAVPPELPCPAVGERVQVEGYTNSINVQAHLYPHIVAAQIKPLGEAAFPKATPVSVESLVKFDHYDQWVSVEGVVLMWTLKEPSLSLMIAGPNHWAVIHIRGFKKADFPTNLHGARIRVTGVNMGISHSAADTMISPSPALLEVLTPGLTNIFDLPLTPVESVVKRTLPVGSRVKVRGVVTGLTRDFGVYVRQGQSALKVQLLHGWLRSTGTGHLYADAGRLPDLKAGDEVELVGSIPDAKALATSNQFSLLWCHARIVGQQEALLPQATTVPEILSGSWTHDLVQLHARLVHLDQVPSERGEWRTTLLIEDEGKQLPAILISKNKNALQHLQLDDELSLVGLVDPLALPPNRQLRLNAVTDVHSLGLSPEVQERRFWVWGGLGILALTFLLIWIGTLQRSLQQQMEVKKKLHHLNATLEERVNERTVELEQAHADLHRALEQEKELGELKNQFVTIVSHEFRTPLGIIMSAIELLQHYEDRLPAEQKVELMDDIHRSTRLMAELMEQVLVLGRVEAGKQGCRLAAINVETLIGKITDESLSATNRKCHVEWLPEGNLEGAMADEALLRHIFSNLITNAIKYSPEGEHVLFTMKRENSDAVFQVIDHGIGIPADDLVRLFEAFHRCSNVGEIPGTGLGLVIVKRCVELHGGHLELDSAVGLGTTFTVRLPLYQV